MADVVLAVGLGRVTGKLPATFVGDLGGRVAVVSTLSGRTVRTLSGSQPPGSGPRGGDHAATSFPSW